MQKHPGKVINTRAPNMNCVKNQIKKMIFYGLAEQ